MPIWSLRSREQAAFTRITPVGARSLTASMTLIGRDMKITAKVGWPRFASSWRARARRSKRCLRKWRLLPPPNGKSVTRVRILTMPGLLLARRRVVRRQRQPISAAFAGCSTSTVAGMAVLSMTVSMVRVTMAAALSVASAGQRRPCSRMPCHCANSTSPDVVMIHSAGFQRAMSRTPRQWIIILPLAAAPVSSWPTSGVGRRECREPRRKSSAIAPLRRPLCCPHSTPWPPICKAHPAPVRVLRSATSAMRVQRGSWLPF